jgi:hypothetical protein
MGENCEPIDKQKVDDILEQYKTLNRSEQIYLLLQVGGCSKPTGLELQKTIAWLRANFLEDYAVAIPKEDVYFLYTSQALRDGLKPVSTADFGKLVRQVFPEVKARRLGQRGSSKYCYANIRRKTVPDEPELPEIPPLETEKYEEKILAWGTRAFGVPVTSLEEFSQVMACCQGFARPLKQTSSRSPTPTTSIATPARSNSTDDPELVKLEQTMPHLRQLLCSGQQSFVPVQSHKRRHVSAFPSSSTLPPPPLRSASVPVGENYSTDSGFGSEGSTPRNPMLSSTADVFQPEEEIDLFGELFGY